MDAASRCHGKRLALLHGDIMRAHDIITTPLSFPFIGQRVRVMDGSVVCEPLLVDCIIIFMIVLCAKPSRQIDKRDSLVLHHDLLNIVAS
jgi:hypothetical protein